ncbi:MAG: 4-hydroxy-tetrahydrodipicolinate synthase [Clostridiales bacterium]|nr:4-hydroxy-tetrahydrodipicolinate synthase [Clostridiales bacterium]
MKTPIFTGSAVAIITPFDKEGNVHYETLRKLIDWQIDNGTDAIVICGTTGESSTLTHAEHVDCIKCCVEHTAGRVPVIAGTGSNDTAYAVELSKEACALGADALLLVTPYYNKTSQRGLVAHFTAIADAVDKPIILYNVPSRTVVNIQPETYLELSKHPRINGIKEAGGNVAQMVKTAALCGDEMNMWSGNDDQITAVCAMGGKGVISVLANIMPRETHDIAQAFLDGDAAKSLELQTKYLDLANAMFCDVNPIPVKEAVAMLGFDVGGVRMPLCPMSQENRAAVRKLMEAHGLLRG